MLEDYVTKTYSGPTIGDEKEILHQITSGLAYLHRIFIVHRDIKPNNILISVPNIKENKRPIMKLADFGLTKIMRTDQGQFSTGASGWKAPESMIQPKTNQRRHYDFSVDIFPLGCVFGYTLSEGGKHPFGENATEQDYRIMKKEPMISTSRDLKIPYCYDETAILLIQSMVLTKPFKRLTANQILDHSFFYRTEQSALLVHSTTYYLLPHLPLKY